MTDLIPLADHKPVAWKYRWKIDGEYVGWRYSDASNYHRSLDGFEEVPLYEAPPDHRLAVALEEVTRLREALTQMLSEYDEVDLEAAVPHSLTVAVFAARAALHPEVKP